MHYSQNDFIFRVHHFKADVISLDHIILLQNVYLFLHLYTEANNAKSLFQFSNNKLM